MRYEIPPRVDINSTNIIIKELEDKFIKLNNNDSFVFDFTNCKYISPTGVAYISLIKDRMNQKGVKTFIRYVRSGRFTGFLKLFGLIEDKQYDEKILEVFSRYTVKIHRCLATTECYTVHESIMEKIVERTKCKTDTYVAINYMLNEIWDNAGVHGYRCYNADIYPRPIYMCAFSYKDKVEIAIADTGQGIHKSLKKKFPEITAKDALSEAIKDGVTGHPNGSPGFGLFCSTEFTKSNNGIFNIWSSGRQLKMIGSSVEVGKCYFYDGTIVSFEISKNINIPFTEILNRKNPSSHNTTEEYLELIDSLTYEK